MEESPPSGPQIEHAEDSLDIDLAARPDHFLLGFEDDVTKLALFVPSEVPPAIGENRLIRLSLPSGGVVDAIGEVKLHRPGFGPRAGGYVICFLELDEGEKSALAAFVRASTSIPVARSLSGPPSSRRSTGRMRAVLDVQIGPDVEAEVTLESESQFFNGFSENIGDGGIFVQSWAHKKVGDHLTLRIVLPDDEEEDSIETVGEVRWVRPYDRNQESPPGFGITFLDLDPLDKKRIEEFLKKREPLFYDD